MRNYYKLLVSILVIYILAVGLFVFISGRDMSKLQVNEDNVLILNDIAKKAEENWPDLSSIESSKYAVDYVILDQNGNVLKDSNSASGDIRISVEEAVKNRYPYAYIIVNNNVTGSVILKDNGSSAINSMRLATTIGFAVTGLILAVGAVIYGIYIKKNIIDPFRKMEQFAGKVAEGNLDEPLMIEKNNMFGSFSESFDIMREELSASKQREIALQKKERETVASLSHDLKTPVTGIKLTAELLKAKEEMKSDDSDIVDKLDNIYKKADEIDVLITDLFASTLEDLGEFKVSCVDEPSSVLSDILKKYDDKGLVVEDKRPDVIISIDSKRMGQVVGNIINNSYKYADTRIDVHYEIVDDFLEMRIKDYGPGVPEDELAHVTNKFYRGKKQEESKAEGSGLGLYIANILMQKMNGEMIPSNDGGFKITLLIPLS
ncbi:MAG: HAMP domain-containing histidine kinase [Clostridiales bacterium]|nr:HAMP domain-containing histidine kinase [Clostridiales bacterium]